MRGAAFNPRWRPMLGRRCSAVLSIAALAGGLAAPSGVAAQGAPREIHFAAGQSSIEISGTVRGDAGIDHRLRALAGQTLSVRMTQLDHRGLSFNVKPEGALEAMAIGEQQGLAVQLRLPADGAYVISTFLPRSAARRQEQGRYRLSVSVEGQALPPLPAARDARVAGTPYHATAQISCRWAYAPAAGLCTAGVVRRGPDATATVDIHGPDGHRRRLLFVRGALAASDSAWPVKTRRSGDRTTVELDGDERHELPDALLTGG